MQFKYTKVRHSRPRILPARNKINQQNTIKLNNNVHFYNILYKPNKIKLMFCFYYYLSFTTIDYRI